MYGIEKWRPVFAPEAEVGTGEAEGGAPPGGGEQVEQREGPGSGRSSIRRDLEKGFEQSRRTEEQPQRERTKSGQYVSRARQEQETREQETEGEDKGQEQQQEQQQEAPEVAAPEGWAAEAKAEWANLPAAVQAAVAKRETDTQKGVEELRSRYAEIDRAIQPRLEVIRRHGVTPAAAVNQLFAWFEALSANPDVSFPALAKSFNYDLRRSAAGAPQQQQQQQAPAAEQQQQQQQPAAETWQTYLDQKLGELTNQFGQKFGMLENTFAQQSQQRTDDFVATWARGKPYFEEVRQTMGQLLVGLSNTNSLPTLQNGTIDLDQIYDMAIHANRAVRDKLAADAAKQADAERKRKADAERKAQQDQAEKARRASGSVRPGAPGAPEQPGGQRKGERKTVRQSILDAKDELSQ